MPRNLLKGCFIKRGCVVNCGRQKGRFLSLKLNEQIACWFNQNYKE